MHAVPPCFLNTEVIVAPELFLWWSWWLKSWWSVPDWMKMDACVFMATTKIKKKIIISCVRFYFEIFDKNLHLKNRTNKSCICHLMLQLAHYHINLSCISWMVDFSKMMTWPDVTVLNREINIRPCQVSYMIKSRD